MKANNMPRILPKMDIPQVLVTDLNPKQTIAPRTGCLSLPDKGQIR